MNTQTNWEEDFDKLVDLVSQSTDFDNAEYKTTRDNIKSFIRKQIEEAERKVAEQIIEDIPDFLDQNVDYGYDAQYLKQQLKAKYLTPHKEK